MSNTLLKLNSYNRLYQNKPQCMSSQLLTFQKQTQKTLDFKQKFKTEVLTVLSKKCRFYYEKGFCPFNKFCAFAHNQYEIREKKQLNLKYKTKPCRAFFDQGFCKYGDRCQYIHKILDSDTASHKTRSSSEQTLSSRSSDEQRSTKSSSHTEQSQSRHLSKYELLTKQAFDLFEMMMGGQSKMSQWMNAGTICNRSESDECSRSDWSEQYSGLGACQEKKSRMYSM